MKKNKDKKNKKITVSFLVFVITLIVLLVGMNVANAGIKIVPAPYSYSARVLNVWYSGVTNLRETVNLKAKVKNIGADFPQSCELWFLVEGNGQSKWVGPESCYPLNSGDEREYTIPLELESAGRYNFCGEIWYKFNDKYYSLSEKVCNSFYARGIYSARINRLWDVEIGEDGRAVLWAEVENNGDNEIDSRCKVRYWVRGPGGVDSYVGDTNCWMNWKGENGPLKPGEKRWYEFKWPAIRSGNYEYWAIVECNGKEVSKWSEGRYFEVIKEEEIEEVEVMPQEEYEDGIRERDEIDYCIPLGEEISLCIWIKN